MLCQHCHQRPANTFISRTVGGQTTQLHLCSECAKALAFDKVSFLGFDLPHVMPSRKTCPTCGATMHSISSSGRIGCPDCYTFFEKELAGAIARTHGNVTHTDHSPAPVKKSKKEELEEALHKAIGEENFELAATLRDEIRALKEEEK